MCVCVCVCVLISPHLISSQPYEEGGNLKWYGMTWVGIGLGAGDARWVMSCICHMPLVTDTDICFGGLVWGGGLFVR